MPLLELPTNTLGRHNSSNALTLRGVGMAAAHSLWGRIRDGGWATEGFGEAPGFLGEGLGLGDPPSGDAAVKGDPAPMGDGAGNTPGEGAGEVTPGPP